MKGGSFDAMIRDSVRGEVAGPRQIEIMAGLTQDGAAWLCGKTTRWLRSALGAPRRSDGRYNARDLVAWLLLKTDADEALTGTSGKDSPALERLRDEKSKIAKIDRLVKEGALLPRAEVHGLLTRLGGILKGTGERLQRDHGAAALEILNEGLADFEHEMAAKFGEQTPAVEPEKPKRGRKEKAE
jgi:hypothetical protein